MTRPAENPTARHPRRHRAAALAITAAAIVLAGVGYGITRHRDDDLSARQAEVKSIGASVMPFDLERTTHTFTDLSGGGRQSVTANDPADTPQIDLVRQHLRAEADKFRRGDFTDPGIIHGQDMPGLAALRAGAGKVDVRFDEIPAGAQLTYQADDPILVAGIHSWFKAQSMDHGSPHG